MALFKLDLAVAALVAAGMLWIEHEHRIIIGTPVAAEVAAPEASACPATDDVPFSADCIAFMGGGGGGVLPDIHSRVSAAPSAPAVSPEAYGRAELHAPACPPSNENAPYSATCIKFMSGWYWHANPTEYAP
jgi:hypothetical protein